MYSVLIADDNAITRKSILLTVDWAGLGCRVTAEAEDGVTALALAKEKKPQLIITDIRMPGMDGLELTQKIHECSRWAKVIIITGYSEFSYAKEALRIGAFDLIVKPIDNQELIGAVKKAVSALDAEQKEKSERESLQDAVRKNKDQILAKLVIDNIEGMNTLSFCGAEVQRFFLFSVDYKAEPKTEGELILQKLMEGSARAAEAVKAKYGCDLICFSLNGRFTVVVEARAGQVPMLTDRSIGVLCGYFIQNTPELGACRYVVGVSGVHTRPNEIKAAYHESLGSLTYSFYCPGEKIILWENVKVKGVVNEGPVMKKISGSIRQLNLKEFDEAMDELRGMLMAETPGTQSVKCLMENICFVALDFYHNTKGYRLYNYKSHSEITAEIEAVPTLDEVLSYVKDLVESLVRCPENGAKEDYSKVTLQVIDYLNEHYDRKVSLQEISDYVSLSPSYLSRELKKDTGESFVDLFNKIKISMAKKLLAESNLKVYEVANKVGIDNYSYFYQLFKKATGTAPTDYYRKSAGILPAK